MCDANGKKIVDLPSKEVSNVRLTQIEDNMNSFLGGCREPGIFDGRKEAI